jgi:hypothetical protein
MVLCWIEVILSVVCWSFAISVVTMIRDESLDSLLYDEFENLASIKNVTSAESLITDVTQGNFLWGFWLFLISGTICGGLCAIFAQWAAEGSLLNCVCDAVTGLLRCILCCGK